MRATPPHMKRAFLMLALSMAACHRTKPAPYAGAPMLDAIRPDSVQVPPGAVVEVVLVGRGFAPGRPGMNTVRFAGVSIGNVPANAKGTELRFVIPQAMTASGEAPPIPLEGGPYTIRVVTAGGVSNPLTIRVYR